MKFLIVMLFSFNVYSMPMVSKKTHKHDIIARLGKSNPTKEEVELEIIKMKEELKHIFLKRKNAKAKFNILKAELLKRDLDNKELNEVLRAFLFKK